MSRATPKAIAGARLQAVLVAATVALALMPPAAGPMLIAPVVPASTGDTVRWAAAAGALLLAPGPYPGSVFVAASTAALLPAALAHGALLLSTRVAGCGTLQKADK